MLTSVREKPKQEKQHWRTRQVKQAPSGDVTWEKRGGKAFFFVVCGVYDTRLWPQRAQWWKKHPPHHMVNQQNQWGHFHPMVQRLPLSMACRSSGKRSHWARSVQVWKRRPQLVVYFGRCWFGELFLAMNSSMLCCISLAVRGNTSGQLWTPAWLSFGTIWNVYSSHAAYF